MQKRATTLGLLTNKIVIHAILAWITISNFLPLPAGRPHIVSIFRSIIVTRLSSQMWLRYVWLMAWQICLSVVCDVRAPYTQGDWGGLTFRGYFYMLRCVWQRQRLRLSDVTTLVVPSKHRSTVNLRRPCLPSGRTKNDDSVSMYIATMS